MAQSDWVMKIIRYLDICGDVLMTFRAYSEAQVQGATGEHDRLRRLLDNAALCRCG